MLGAALMVVVLVVVIPVAVLISGGVASAILGSLLKQEAEVNGDEIWRQLNR